MTSNVPRKIEGRTTSISFGLVTELTVADETVNLILEKIQDPQCDSLPRRHDSGAAAFSSGAARGV